MAEIANYRVLWVDDDEDVIVSFPPYVGEQHHIDLDVATNWEEAEQLLRLHFKEYSAIILDAFCKIKKTDKVPSNLFLGHVAPRLSMIFGEKQAFIPWYVLSAGTMEHFDIVRNIIETEERKQMQPLWGEMLYKKEKDTQLQDSKNVEKLLNNIKKIAAEKTTNKVLLRHADVFKYLGKEEFVDYAKSRTCILKMLSALYNPEENLNYVYEGNPLRHVVEYIFRTANEYGLLPDDCFDDDDHVVLLDSSRFMAGMTIRCFDRKKKTTVNYFKRMKPGTTPVFSEVDAEVVRDILNFSNSGSHTSKNDPYIIEEDKKEIFFGYVLLLCHVIKSFGKYLELHSDKDTNITSIEKIVAPSKGEDAKVTLSHDKKVALFNEKCKLPDSFIYKEGEMVVLKEVDVNGGPDSATYPLFAKIDNSKISKAKIDKESKNKLAEEKPKVEVTVNTSVPQKESLIGKEGIVRYGGKGSKFIVIGAYCKLPNEFRTYFGKKTRIIEIDINPDAEANELPYIATKVELIVVEPKKEVNIDCAADDILANIDNV